MTLNDLKRQIGGFMDFLAISGCDTDLYIIQKVASRIQIENLVFVGLY